MTIRKSLTVVLEGDDGPVNEWASYLAAEMRYRLENDRHILPAVTYWIDDESDQEEVST